MSELLPSQSLATAAPPPQQEAGSSMVEYVGLGALSAMLVSGITAAVDSAAGDRLGAAIVKRLLAAVSGTD